MSNNEDVKLLGEISTKLDQLIVLFKLSNKETLDSYRKKLAADKVYLKTLELANDPRTYSELSTRVANELSVAEITVRKKMSELVDMGLLLRKREGRNVYYINSGLLD